MDRLTSKTQNSNVNIVLSNTYLSGFYKIINKIEKQLRENPNDNIILVVPDKFSLNAEQIFMERTGLSSVFNVWLTTFSRLISKVVSTDENNFTLLSKNSGTMLVSKIILENIDKISTYKKIANSYNLAETMYNVINLLKSSGVTPNELKQNFNTSNFGLKIKDIYLVYSEYEKYMKSCADVITRLDIFNNKVKFDNYIKSSHIYFANFDSFTNVQLNSLANLAKHSKSFTISLCANTLQNNSHIYDNTVFAKLKSYFDDYKLHSTIENISLSGTKLQNYLAKNLFAICREDFIEQKLETNCVKITECSNIQDEVRYVASKIKYLVLSKCYTFDDINVSVNNLGDYKQELQRVFEEFGFPYYLDSSRTILEHYFSRTVLKIADFVCGLKTISNAISIVDSPLFDIENSKKYDFQNYCQKYNVSNQEFYSVFNLEDSELCKNAEEIRNKIFEPIKNFEISLTYCKTEIDFKNELLIFLNVICAKQIINKISQTRDDLIEKNIDLEVYQKFENVLAEADAIVGTSQISMQSFFDMLKSCLSAVNLLTTPLKCDAIFVGDASKSTYYPRKILFVLGSTQSRMPEYSIDAGTLTDAEIAIFKANKNICPTIKEINKREKFKLFNLLLLPSDILELTYSTLINNQLEVKSEFVSALQKILTTNGRSLKIEKYELQELKIFDETDYKYPAFMVGTLKNAVKIAKGKFDNLRHILESQFDAILATESKKYLDSDKRFNITNIREKIFANNKTKISQIERYFRCPFLQFVDYGISPKENPKFEIKSVDVGNILHEVAQHYVEKYIKDGYQFKNEDGCKIFDMVIKMEKYKNFSKNAYSIKNLKDEALRFCAAIKNQILSSEFKPYFTEKKFENFEIGNNLTISGIVDRVDVFNQNNETTDSDNESQQYVRIIDYKTGKDKFSYEDIYYGIKLQLLVYTSAITKTLKSIAASAGYMPVKNSFNDFFDEEFSAYKIDGITLKNNGMILRLDKNLVDSAKSNIINVEFKKSGEYTANTEKYLLDYTEFLNLQKYAFDVINKAVEEILSSYINPKPYKTSASNPCAKCKYKSLCHYQIESSGFRKIETKNKAKIINIYNDRSK